MSTSSWLSDRSNRGFKALSLFWLALLILQSATFQGLGADNDFSGPQLAITSHGNGQIVNTKTITLSGTATDAGRGGHGISSVYLRGTIPGATTAGDGTANWSQSITLSPGANSIDVYAYDNSEGKNSTTVTITINFQPVDSLPPSIAITSHQNGQTVNTKTITLTGTATDAGLGNNGISSVYVRGTIPGATAAGSGIANWSQNLTLYPGANSIDIWAYDNSDVQNSKTVSIIINFQPVDPLPPTITVTSHTNGQTVATSSIQFSGTATDAGRGNNGISSVYVQGTLPNSTASGADILVWSKTVNLFPGPNSISVYAYDNSDVQNETVQTLTINFKPGDSLGPNLTISSHTDGQTVTTSSIVLTGSASDAGRGDHGISYVYVQGRLPDSNTAGAGVVNWSKAIELSPGRNSITVYAYDSNEFPNETSQTIVINFQPADALGPNLAVTSHTDGQTVSTKTITIQGTASDAGRGNNGISAVYAQGKIEGATAAGAETVNWSRTVELSPGRNFISLSAYDNSPFPNVTTLSLTITLQPADALPPSLVVTSHTYNQIVSENVITLSGTASDSGRGDHGVAYVKVNGQRAANDTAAGAGTAAWSRTFGLIPGPNNIQVAAADNSEFPQETNVTMRVIYEVGDVNPPTITIDSPRNNQTVSTSPLTISGTATDAGQGGNGVSQVTVNGVVVNGATATVSSTANWSQTVNLKPGANVIAVVAVDDSINHNSGTATITVIYDPVDSLPPLLSIDSHKKEQTVATSTIVLAGTATDGGQGNSGIASVTINGERANNDTAAGAATANWSRIVPLNPGPNVISVVARDNSAQQNSTAQSITVTYDPTDTTPPDLQITSHRKGQTVAQPTILLSGTATDAGFGDHGIAQVTVNSQPATGGTASGAGTALWSRELTLSLGPNLISIVAQDDSPAKNSTALTLTIIYEPEDKTPPDLEVTSHKDGQTVISSSVLLSGVATDHDRGDNGVASVTVNNSPATGGAVSGAAQANWSQLLTLQPGANVISVVAQDTKNNKAAKTLSLIYDPQATSGPQEFCWVTNSGGAGVDIGYAISVDLAGNSYVTGSFEGTATFGSTVLTSRGTDIFVAKYGVDGALLWARQAGGTNADAGFGIAADRAGNCYVAGYFTGQADVSGTNLTTSGTYDLFLAKYNTAGNLLWATTTGHSSALYASGIALGANDDVYVTGAFFLNAEFDGTPFENSDTSDGFIAKFNTNGELQWASQFGGEGNDAATAVAVSSSNRICVTGYFEGEGFFSDDESLFSIGDRDMFVAQFDSDGNTLWTQQAGALQTTQGASVAFDANGNAWVAGFYDGLAVFGTNTLSNVGFFDSFVAKYDNLGNLLWVRNSDKSSTVNAAGVATDADGNGYVVGSFSGSASFGGLTPTNGNASQILIAKYDREGSLVWAKQTSGSSTNFGYGIALSPDAACYIVGSVSQISQFGAKTVTAGQKPDSVVARLQGGGGNLATPLTLQSLGNLQFQLQFSGDSCTTYRLQSSTNLTSWSTLLATNALSGTVTYPISAPPAPPYQFFRVLW